MSDFEHIKNDMSIFGHIKKHIIKKIKKEHRQDRYRDLGGVFGCKAEWRLGWKVGTHDLEFTHTGVLELKTSLRSI